MQSISAVPRKSGLATRDYELMPGQMSGCGYATGHVPTPIVGDLTTPQG